MRITLLILSIFICLIVNGQAIEWKTEHQTIDVPNVPLSNEEIAEIFVDKDGLVWIISFTNIFNYDGVSFNKFDTDDFVHGAFLRIKEFDNGMKAVIDYNGRLFIIQNKEVKPYPFNDTLKDLNYRNGFRDFTFLNDSTLLIAFNNRMGPIQFNHDGTYENLFEQYNFKGTGTFIIYLEGIETPFISGGNVAKPKELRKKVTDTTYLLNSKMEIVDKIDVGFKKYFLSKEICQINDSTYLFSTGDGQLISLNSNGFLKLLEYPDPVIRLLSDEKNLYVSTINNGVHVYKKNEIKYSMKQIIFPDSRNALTGIDNQGGLWFSGSRGDVKFQRNKFLTTSNLKPEARIVFQNNTMFVSNRDQLLFFKNDSIFNSFTTQDNKPIYDLYAAKSGDDLFLGAKNGLFRFQNNTLKQLEDSAFNDVSGDVYRFVDYLGVDDIKVAGFAGEECFTIDWSNQIKVYPAHDYRIRNAVFCSDFYATKLMTGDVKILWNSGSYDTTFIKQHLEHFIDFKKFGPSYLVSHMYGGILSINPDSAQEIKFNGLSIENAYLAEYDSNIIWAFNRDASFRIEYEIEQDTFKVELYEPIGVFPINKVTIHEGEVYIFRKNGKTSKIKLTEIRKYELQSTTKILKVETSKEVFNIAPSVVNINSEQRDLKLTWNTFNYQNREITLRYSLSNGEPIWKEIKGNSINFESLPYGEQNFILQEKQLFGEWTTVGQIKINVDSPWWQSWWAVLASILLLIVIVILINRYTVNKKLEDNLKVIEKIDTELRVLRSQMNPHFLSNLISSIKFLVIDGQNKKANLALGLLAKLSRRAFNYSTKQTISLDEEVTFIQEYILLHEIRIDSKIHFEYELYNIGNPDQFLIYPFLIQPLIENSIVHGIKGLKGEKRISLTIAKVDDFIEIEVIDNGIGGASQINKKIKRNEKASSTKLILEKIALISDKDDTNFYGEDIKDKDGKNIGSKVFLRVKIQG